MLKELYLIEYDVGRFIDLNDDVYIFNEIENIRIYPFIEGLYVIDTTTLTVKKILTDSAIYNILLDDYLIGNKVLLEYTLYLYQQGKL